MVLSKPRRDNLGDGELFLMGLWEQVGCLPACSDCGSAASVSGQGNN